MSEPDRCECKFAYHSPAGLVEHLNNSDSEDHKDDTIEHKHTLSKQHNLYYCRGCNTYSISVWSHLGSHTTSTIDETRMSPILPNCDAPYTCPLCGVDQFSKATLGNHILTAHPAAKQITLDPDLLAHLNLQLCNGSSSHLPCSKQCQPHVVRYRSDLSHTHEEPALLHRLTGSGMLHKSHVIFTCPYTTCNATVHGTLNITKHLNDAHKHQPIHTTHQKAMCVIKCTRCLHTHRPAQTHRCVPLPPSTTNPPTTTPPPFSPTRRPPRANTGLGENTCVSCAQPAQPTNILLTLSCTHHVHDTCLSAYMNSQEPSAPVHCPCCRVPTSALPPLPPVPPHHGLGPPMAEDR